MIDRPEQLARARYARSERASNFRYAAEILTAGLVYVVLLETSLHFVGSSSGAGKIAFALLPMLGIAGMVVAIVRFVWRSDEFVRQTVLASGAIAATISKSIAVGCGFLENARTPHADIGPAWPLIVGTFGVALPFVRHRYR